MENREKITAKRYRRKNRLRLSTINVASLVRNEFDFVGLDIDGSFIIAGRKNDDTFNDIILGSQDQHNLKNMNKS
jgi:hypothetical protein